MSSTCPAIKTKHKYKWSLTLKLSKYMGTPAVVWLVKGVLTFFQIFTYNEFDDQNKG